MGAAELPPLLSRPRTGPVSVTARARARARQAPSLLYVDVGGPGRAEEGRRPPPSAGLVTSKEQVRRSEDAFFVCGVDARLSRMKSGVVLSARLIQELTLSSDVGRRAAMVTLTYRPGARWAPNDVSKFMDLVGKWASRRGRRIPYVWVAELQARGAVHYHVVLWLPKGVTVPKPDKQGWWPHGMTRVEWARRAVSYLAKYASKGRDSGERFPRGLRLWSAGGLCGDGREWRQWLRLPSWLRRAVGDREHVSRVPLSGGIWLGERTGRVWRSPFEFVRVQKSERVAIGVWLRPRGVYGH